MTGKATRASTRSKAPIPTGLARATRARSATTTTTKGATTATAIPKKPAARKPLVNRDNAVEVAVSTIPPRDILRTGTAKPVKGTSWKRAKDPLDADREPIMAYLRIRPHLGEDESVSMPYLTPLSDTSVRMTDPNHDGQSNTSRFRPSTLPQTSIYTFSHIFPPATTQSDFFTKTTLPLVRDVLQGQNALLFTYGATNSGKTYTVQGGSKEGSAGIVPRTLDVIFNSIDGLHSDGKYRPVRLHGVELADPSDSNTTSPQLNLTVPEPALAQVLAQHLDSTSISDTDVDSTILKLDRNHEYSIWLSYAEVYNEKVYDLFASVTDATKGPHRSVNNTPLLTRKALPLKTSPPSDSPSDDVTAGKYIDGLRQFRVHSASQAKALVKLGQLHRRVFGTLANRESSRSHGMVILKVVRGHRGERDDPTALQISRLTLVDLAGSERTKHTQTTGDRLKEAGNINKSLMVLGQCMEVMRSNQRRLAVSLAAPSEEGGRVDTRDVRKGLAVVPFRHSKLTEALMDYFIGDGRAVMIVNVNPYDTGYDENSHVMKFAALAREVYITPAPAPLQRAPTAPAPTVGPGKTKGTVVRELGPLTLKDPDIVPKPYLRRVTLSTRGVGGKPNEAILEVLEEDEADDADGEDDDDDGDDEPANALVSRLFDEIEDLRMQLFESEIKCAIIEAETREEVMHEMEERMRKMEKMYERRLMSEVEHNEIKTDAKIDLLHQSGMFWTSPVKMPSLPQRVIRNVKRREQKNEDEEAEDVEMSLVHLEDDKDDCASGEEFNFDNCSESEPERSRSPLASKGPVGGTQVIRPKDKKGKIGINNVTKTSNGSDEDEDETEGGNDDDGGEDNEWIPAPPAPSSSRVPVEKASKRKISNPTPGNLRRAALAANKERVAKLQQELDTIPLAGDTNNVEDSVIILPAKKFRVRQPSIEADEESQDSDIEVTIVKKKKRQLGNKPVMTEDQIERATRAAEMAGNSQNVKNIRRLAGR